MKVLNVKYLGAQVGVLAEARGGIVFEYDPVFLRSGHELSPLELPLGPGIRQRDSGGSMRLLGLFEDSLPDAWGTKIMTEWFQRHGTPEHAITPLAKLAYIGARGMGALTYEPSQDPGDASSGPLSLGQLYTSAEQADQGGPIDLNVLAAVGSSAGGARPKALIALPEAPAAPVVGGEGPMPPGYEPWLVKFSGRRDTTLGVMEEAYARMARAAGIDLPETRLLATEHDGLQRQHFAVKRFDRSLSERIHHHTLAAMTHLLGGDLSYEMLLRATRRVTRDEGEVWRAYRRAAFNVLASNRDDHGKNHGFLYENRQWRLGPAYDITFAGPQMLPERGMSMAGERKNVGQAELLKLAETEALDRHQATTIIEQTREAVSRWREFAVQSGVPELKVGEVESVLNCCGGPKRGPLHPPLVADVKATAMKVTKAAADFGKGNPDVT